MTITTASRTAFIAFSLDLICWKSFSNVQNVLSHLESKTSLAHGIFNNALTLRGKVEGLSQGGG
jgi:hypothetical protein